MSSHVVASTKLVNPGLAMQKFKLIMHNTFLEEVEPLLLNNSKIKLFQKYPVIIYIKLMNQSGINIHSFRFSFTHLNEWEAVHCTLCYFAKVTKTIILLKHSAMNVNSCTSKCEAAQWLDLYTGNMLVY